ncbi:hypothetical protein FOA52_009137, partial [Chlamydomonas sp. UWO 241]
WAAVAGSLASFFSVYLFVPPDGPSGAAAAGRTAHHADHDHPSGSPPAHKGSAARAPLARAGRAPPRGGEEGPGGGGEGEPVWARTRRAARAGGGGGARRGGAGRAGAAGVDGDGGGGGEEQPLLGGSQLSRSGDVARGVGSDGAEPGAGGGDGGATAVAGEELKGPKEAAVAVPPSVGFLLSLLPAAHREVMCSPGVASLMAVKMVSNFASALFHSMFTVILKAQGLGPKHVGWAMSMIGLGSIAVQALVVAPVTKRLGERAGVHASLWGLLGGFIMLACANGVGGTMASLAPQVVAGTLLSTMSTSLLTQAVPVSRRGTALALDMGLWSGVRMAAPGAAAWLLASFGPPSLGAAAAALIAALLGAMHLQLLVL